MRKYELIIFDLDGTILDTSQGIFNSVRYTEKEMNFSPISDESLKEFVGPPPQLMYMKMYGVDEATAFVATQKHREYGKSKAIYEATVYPQIRSLLIDLKNKGYKLAVSTLKSQEIAEQILNNFGLIQYFDAIEGMDVKESLTKCMTIQNAIRQTETSGKVLMVGDSWFDYEGAVQANIDFVGVLYGFGFQEEKKYQFKVISKPEELVIILNKGQHLREV